MSIGSLILLTKICLNVVYKAEIRFKGQHIYILQLMLLMFMSGKASNETVLHFQTVLKVELTLLFKR